MGEYGCPESVPSIEVNDLLYGLGIVGVDHVKVSSGRLGVLKQDGSQS